MNAYYVTTDMLTGLANNGNTEETIHMPQDQLKTRPEIDDVVCHNLDGEALKEALFIIENIREHNMKINWSSVNIWSVQYKRKHVCDLRIDKGSLHIGQVSGVLAIRVTNMSYDRESINRLIESLRDSIVGTQEPNYAFQ